MIGNQFKILLLAIVIALAIGLAGGYFYGNTIGKKVGRENLLAEQKVAAEAAAQEAQKKIVEQANPFSETVNPFEKGYTNPFEGTNVNPFGQ